MMLSKLTFSNINSSSNRSAFEKLLANYGYHNIYISRKQTIAFTTEVALIATSEDSAFFYAIQKDDAIGLTNEDIQFAAPGEIVIIDPGCIIIHTSSARDSVQIFSESKLELINVASLPRSVCSTISDYACRYNAYYLGYEKRYAEVYDKGGTTWEATTPNQSLVNLLLSNPEFFKGKRLIDLGCGEGRDSIYLSSLGIDVVGVDISRSALNKAREIAHLQKVKAKFIETNVLYLNGIPDKYFDTAINMGCLHMIVNKKERLSHIKNVQRILQTGGTFIIDHCQENWGKGFFSLPGRLYQQDKLVVGNVIERRVRSNTGTMILPLEVIPYAEMKADALINEVCSAGFISKFVIFSDTEAFGNSCLVVFEKQ